MKLRITVVAYVGFDENRAGEENYFLCDGVADNIQFQAAADYVEHYQSKWYRRVKRWFLSLFRKWDGVSLDSGRYNLTGTIYLSSPIIISGSHTTIQGQGSHTIIQNSASTVRNDK